MNILFVCTGNTCRSPMAEAIMKHKKHNWNIQSAGVYATSGSPAAQHVQQLLKEKKIACHHISQGISCELINWAEYIFTMTDSHKQAILSLFPEASSKVWNLKEFVSGKQEGVADPYGGALEEYRRTYAELDELVTQLIEKLSAEEGNILERGHHETKE